MSKTINETETERHRAKMAKRKAVQDAEVADKVRSRPFAQGMQLRLNDGDVAQQIGQAPRRNAHRGWPKATLAASVAL